MYHSKWSEQSMVVTWDTSFMSQIKKRLNVLHIGCPRSSLVSLSTSIVILKVTFVLIHVSNERKAEKTVIYENALTIVLRMRPNSASQRLLQTTKWPLEPPTIRCPVLLENNVLPI
jgi:hypothetical protein